MSAKPTSVPYASANFMANNPSMHVKSMQKLMQSHLFTIASS
jgi:hypothetical protein